MLWPKLTTWTLGSANRAAKHLGHVVEVLLGDGDFVDSRWLPATYTAGCPGLLPLTITCEVPDWHDAGDLPVADRNAGEALGLNTAEWPD